MTEDASLAPAPTRPDHAKRRWETPSIEDADVGALTTGSGDSGVEGSSFLKPGS